MQDRSQPWSPEGHKVAGMSLHLPSVKIRKNVGTGEFVGLKQKTGGGPGPRLFSLQAGGSLKEALWRRVRGLTVRQEVSSRGD